MIIIWVGVHYRKSDHDFSGEGFAVKAPLSWEGSKDDN